MTPSCAAPRAAPPSHPSPWPWTGTSSPRAARRRRILSTWWPGGAPRNLSASTSPRAGWPWRRDGCRFAIGPTGRAESAEAPKSWPTTSISGTPNGTAEASTAVPLMERPPLTGLPLPAGLPRAAELLRPGLGVGVISPRAARWRGSGRCVPWGAGRRPVPGQAFPVFRRTDERSAGGPVRAARRHSLKEEPFHGF